MKKQLLSILLLCSMVLTLLPTAVLANNTPEQEDCTVTFLAGGGTGEMEPVTVEKGESFKLPYCTFEAPEGYMFDCWEYADEVGNPVHEAPAFYMKITCDVEITAIWKEKKSSYTISFDLSDISGTIEDIIVPAGGEVMLPDCKIPHSSANYVFTCWCNNDDGALRYPYQVLTVNDDISFRPMWRAEEDIHSLTLDRSPLKTVYFEGEDFDPKNTLLKITLVGKNTTWYTSSFDIVNGKNLQAGQKSVTLSYTEKDKTLTCDVPISVYPHIDFMDQPEDCTVFVGQIPDTSLFASVSIQNAPPDKSANFAWYPCDKDGNITGPSLSDTLRLSIPKDLPVGQHYYVLNVYFDPALPSYSRVACVTVEEQPRLTFEKDTVECYYGDTVGNPATSLIEGCKITYSIENEDIAIVDEQGFFNAIGVGTTKVFARVPATMDYKAMEASYTLHVRPRPITVKAGTFKVSKVYDGTTAKGSGTGKLALSNLPSGQEDYFSISVNDLPDYTNPNVGGQSQLSVSYTCKVPYNSTELFTFSPATVSVPCEITPAPLTAYSVFASDISYGQKLSEANITGVAKLNGNEIAGTWAFDTVAGEKVTGDTVLDAGNWKCTVLFTPAAGAENYLPLKAENISFAISKSNVTAPTVSGSYTVDPKDKNSFCYTITPIDKAEYKMDDGEYQDSNVFSGIKPLENHSFYARIREDKNHNPSAPGKVDVSFKKLPNPAIPALEVKLSGSGENRTLTITPVSGAEYSFNGSDWSNTSSKSGVPNTTVTAYIRYKETETLLASAPASQLVNTKKAAQTISFSQAVVSKKYGDEPFALTPAGAVEGSSISYTSDNTNIATVDSNGTIHIRKVGTVVIRATASETETHDSASAQYALSISPASLTIKAEDKQMLSTKEKPVYTASYTGLVYGDSVTAVNYTDNVTDSSICGAYTIMPTGCTISSGNENYTISYQPGALTISIDLYNLNAAIERANNAKKGIYTDERKPNQVVKGTRYVSSAEKTALDKAIDTAVAAKSSVYTNGQVDTAANTLNEAVAKFNSAIKTGTFVAGGGGYTTLTVNEKAEMDIRVALNGQTVEMELPANNTVVEKKVFEALRGRNVTLRIKTPTVQWSVYGRDMPKNVELKNLDLGVTLNPKRIPAAMVTALKGKSSTDLSINHNGDFGFPITMELNLGMENGGMFANVYKFMTASRTMEFRTASHIAAGGRVMLRFTGASDYAIIIDDYVHPHHNPETGVDAHS